MDLIIIFTGIVGIVLVWIVWYLWPLHQTKSSSMTNDETRWVVIGICLNKVLTPVLRNILAMEITTWYQVLCQPPTEIDKQVFVGHIKNLNPSTLNLNYRNINNNNALRLPSAFDYAVKDSLSLAKLFLKPFMCKMTGFDQTMDISAVLSVICEAKPFVKAAAHAITVRDEVRNKWAHCNFANWTEKKYNSVFQSMENLLNNVGLSAEKKQNVCDELNNWKRGGLQLCCGHPVNAEILMLLKGEVKELYQAVQEWDLEKQKITALISNIDKFHSIVSEEIDNLRTRVVKCETQADDNASRLEICEKLGNSNFKEIKRLDKKVTAELSRYSVKEFDSSKMDLSKDHNNWITVGELIRLIKEPVALYTSQIVENWHVELCLHLPSGGCTSLAVCQTERNPGYLCFSCKGWYDELAKSHKNKNKRQIKWRENCDTSKWPDDPWEVAKFFMPTLGDNKITVKDAESTDLSSLLNVLAMMKDTAFAPDRRVDLNLVTKLRSEVRNPWAHAPNQELAEAILNDAFDIAYKFVVDLGKVFSFPEVKECIKDIKVLQANGLTKVKETKLKIVNLGLIELGGDVSQIKEEIKRLEEDQSSERQLIKELEKKLENLKKELKSLQQIANSQGTDERSGVKSCIRKRQQIFVGRDTEVKQIISSLVENGCGIVSIVGGPGFGKSSLANEVSHHLSNNRDIDVIFSYLSNASTVPEVVQRLCRDVGVYPGEDPESSLMLRVRSIEKKVVLVMDNIEQLLECDVKSQFTELLLTLRKNSHQHVQILTTTRTEFSIPGEATENIQIGELDEKSSVELLRECCPNENVEDMYLSELTKLCGFVPLALCIAGTRIPDLDDPWELIQWLREKPMEALQNSDQCIRQAIDFSFQKLKDEEKKAFVRISVFNGNFQKKSAQEIIERNGIKTQNFLSNLVTRSLIQRSNDKRFVIHSLIRRFLTDHDQFEDEKTMAQGLMVRHFLEMCHKWTIYSFSRNGFTGARESLKKDAHNVEETLKICSHAANLNSNIREFLANSNIYVSSSRFFYDFGWDLLPQTLLKEFFEFCVKLAKSRNQPAIEITFKCLVADQEGRKYGWKSPEYTNRIERIKEMFHENKLTLKEDRYLFWFCYYSYARYEADQPTADLHVPVDDFASLPVNKASSVIGEVAEALILRERGQMKKKRANKTYYEDKDKYEEYMNCAKMLFKKALLLAKELLGDHELTCILHKQLGDLLFNWHKNEEARAYYHDAITLRKQLKLDSNEQFVFLLKNYGACLSFANRFEESVEKLKEARDIADKLAEKHTSCRAKVYYQLAKVYRHWKPDFQEAAGYATTGMEMQGLLNSKEVKTLQKIIKRAAKNVDYVA